ncbi:MAG: hypothetical protein QXJ97_12665 [Desulfurococcaceae archaeon]
MVEAKGFHTLGFPPIRDNSNVPRLLRIKILPGQPKPLEEIAIEK